MINRNYSLTTLLLLVLVGAVISSVVTAGITGNVIKVEVKTNGTEVYTKTEVDSLLNNISAISCSKDGVCEVNKLNVSGDSFFNKNVSTAYNIHVNVNGVLNGDTARFEGTDTKRLWVGYRPLGGGVNSKNSLYVDEKGVIISNNFTVGQPFITNYVMFRGLPSRNDSIIDKSRGWYLCMDKNARVYVSSSPCV